MCLISFCNFLVLETHVFVNDWIVQMHTILTSENWEIKIYISTYMHVPHFILQFSGVRNTCFCQ